jgi:hypothetical protein
MRRSPLVATVLAIAVSVPLSSLQPASGVRRPAGPEPVAGTRTPEASTATRLADRRSLVTGDRF